MTAPVPMPDNFHSYASERSLRALAAQFKVSCDTVMRWRRELGIQASRYKPWPDDDGYLRANYGTMTAADIASTLGRTVDSVKTRAKKLGLIKARPGVFVRREVQSKLMPGHSGGAAYLQAYGPIYRCHSDGTPAPIGAYWYWAGQVLTHDEMEAKARAHRERRALLDMAA